MRIVEFHAENVKKLKVVVIKPKPDSPLVQLTGDNGQGKTSVLDSILYALAGTEDLPSQPIRRGADKGGIRIDLGTLMVTRLFGPGGTTLRVEGKKGERYQRPQKLLDDLAGGLTFDPLSFIRMKLKDQADTLRSLVRLDVDPDAIDAANAQDYEARRIANRTVKELEAQVGAINIVAELPAEPIDISKLITELQEAGQRNGEVLQARAKLSSMREAIRRSVDEVSDMQRRADALRTELEELEQRIISRVNARTEAEKIADAFVIPAQVDTAELREAIENARATNSQIQRRTEREALQTKLDEQTKLVADLNAAMEARTKTKTDAIAAAKMPVDGLGFENGEVMYNTFPLSQASGAEQLRVAVAIAMAASPELRIIRITDGSLLSDSSLEMIKTMAIERDYQIWIERVDTSGKIGIVLEDGEVKAVNEDEPTEASALAEVAAAGVQIDAIKTAAKKAKVVK
jgi:ABC-type dipeptide/oligopeptide/nickel transport system ATPase component